MGSPEVYFPLLASSAGTVAAVTVDQEEFLHELAVVRLRSAEVTFPEHLAGTAIEIRWGDPVRPEVFLGYVDRVKPRLGDGARSLTVICVGPTYVMRNKRSTVYSATTASAVIRTVAARYQLDADVEDHDYVYPAIIQQNESDWELAVRLAKECGYTFYARGTTLRFHRRTREIERYARYCPSFEYSDQTDGGPPTSATVTEFQPVLGDPPATRTMTVGQDTLTAPQLAPQTGWRVHQPLFTEQIVDRVALDAATAQHWLRGSAEEGRWHVQAQAKVIGDPRLRPSSPVHFTGLPADYAGYWVVVAAKHEIGVSQAQEDTKTPYTVRLKLGRDSTGSSKDAPLSSAIRPPEETPQVRAQLTATGQWRSERLSSEAPVAAVIPEFIQRRLRAR